MIRVAMFPATGPWRENPYLDQIQAGVRASGVEIVDAPEWPSGKWLKGNRNQVDVLHFHWLAPAMRARGAHRRLFKLWKAILQLRRAKTLGYRIVWTVHNLEPHEPSRPSDLPLRKALAANADALVAHCPAAVALLQNRLATTSRIEVIPHPSYHESYAAMPSRDVARQQLKLPSSGTIVLFLGKMRRYKGVEKLLRAWGTVAYEGETLLLVGEPEAEFEPTDLCPHSSNRGSIVHHAGPAPPDAIPSYLAAVDAVVIPYDSPSVLTSGVAALAMTFGRPVVGCARGCIPEMIESAGVLYSPDEPNGLAASLREFLDLSPAQRESLEEKAAELSAQWRREEVGRRTADLYRELCANDSAQAPR